MTTTGVGVEGWEVIGWEVVGGTTVVVTDTLSTDKQGNGMKHTHTHTNTNKHKHGLSSIYRALQQTFQHRLVPAESFEIRGPLLRGLCFCFFIPGRGT